MLMEAAKLLLCKNCFAQRWAIKFTELDTEKVLKCTITKSKHN